ncbi:MAG TPA: carbohydrate ABC transporter permease [bacterium]|nr:carbohydrate ABC transporter permease [bacterium]
MRAWDVARTAVVRAWGVARPVVLYAGVALACLVVGFPIYWMAASALEPGSLFNFPPSFFPLHPVWSNFTQIFTINPLAHWLANSLFVATGTMLCSVALSIHAAYGMSRLRTRPVVALGFLMLIGQMIPVTVLTIPFYILFSELHLLDTLSGVVIATTTFTVPLCLWMLKGFFDGVPRELDEAALTDGCTRLGSLYRVVLPSALPGVVAAATFGFMTGWNEFFFASIFLSTETKWVGTVGLVTYMGQYFVQWSALMATAFVISLVPAVLFLRTQRYMMAGITQGAVKT